MPRLTPQLASLILRVMTAAVIPAPARGRLLAMGLPADVMYDTLKSIRGLREWPARWMESGQRYLGEVRRQTSAGNREEAAQAQQVAALCFHAAQALELDDERLVRQCRVAASSLFARVLPFTHPDVRRVQIPWRKEALPGLLRLPAAADHEPVGLVVLLNGFGVCKEESLAWTDRMIDANLAVLCLDTPGSGEATSSGLPGIDQADLLDGVFDLIVQTRQLDPERVAVAGVSLGANVAVRAAAHEARAVACVAVSPPWYPEAWFGQMSPILRQNMKLSIEGATDEDVLQIARELDLRPVVPQLPQPLLVFGSGRDLIVPPTEAQRLAEQAGEAATLVWYPAMSHCLYSAVDQWSFDMTVWLQALFRARQDGERDRRRLAQLGRAALNEAVFTPRTDDPVADDFPFGEYARLITDAVTDHRNNDAERPD